MDFSKVSKRELYKELVTEKNMVHKLLTIIEMQAQKLKEIVPNDENDEHLLNIQEIKKQYVK